MKTLMVIVLTFLLIGCDGIQHKYLPVVSVISIIKSDSSIYSKIQIVVPRKTVQMNVVYRFKPYAVINHSDTITMRTMEILGSKYYSADSTCSYKYGGVFYTIDTIPLSECNIKSIEIHHSSEMYIYKKYHLRIYLGNDSIFTGEFNDSE
jgi:hypothetical protein